MNYLIAGAVPIFLNQIEDRFYDNKDQIAGPEGFLGMVRTNIPYAGGLSMALYALLTGTGYINFTTQNAVIVGIGVYAPFFITARNQYK